MDGANGPPATPPATPSGTSPDGGRVEALTAQLALRYLDGASLSVLARSSGHSARWVARRLRAAGVQIRPAGRQQVASRRLDAAQLRGWYLESGLSVRAIAALTGVSPSTVQTALQAWGIPARRPGRRPGPARGPAVTSTDPEAD